MNRPGRIFVIGLLAMSLIFALVTGLLLSFRAGVELYGALTGVAASGASAALSYGLMMAVLGASNLGFLRAHFAGTMIRVLLLALVGMLVWGSFHWSVKHYLLAVGLSYPFFLALEAWLLSRALAGRKNVEKA